MRENTEMNYMHVSGAETAPWNSLEPSLFFPGLSCVV